MKRLKFTYRKLDTFLKYEIAAAICLLFGAVLNFDLSNRAYILLLLAIAQYVRLIFTTNKIRRIDALTYFRIGRLKQISAMIRMIKEHNKEEKKKEWQQ